MVVQDEPQEVYIRKLRLRGEEVMFLECNPRLEVLRQSLPPLLNDPSEILDSKRCILRFLRYSNTCMAR